MESIITMILGAFAIVVIWGAFFYITGIRRDRKILDNYIAGKHKRKRKVKKEAAAPQVPVSAQ